MFRVGDSYPESWSESWGQVSGFFFWSSCSEKHSWEWVYSNGPSRNWYVICGPVCSHKLIGCREINLSTNFAYFTPVRTSSDILCHQNYFHFLLFGNRICRDSFEFLRVAFLPAEAPYCLGPFRFDQVVDRSTSRFCGVKTYFHCPDAFASFRTSEVAEESPPNHCKLSWAMVACWVNLRVWGPPVAWIRCWLARQCTISKSPP